MQGVLEGIRVDYFKRGTVQYEPDCQPGRIEPITTHALLHSMSLPSSFLPSPPDPAFRQPFTIAALLPLYSLYHVLAVLAILPHTFILKLALLPILLWQAWECAVGLDFAAGLANLFGLESSARLRHFNFMFVVRFLWSNIPLLSLLFH